MLDYFDTPDPGSGSHYLYPIQNWNQTQFQQNEQNGTG